MIIPCSKREHDNAKLKPVKTLDNIHTNEQFAKYILSTDFQ